MAEKGKSSVKILIIVLRAIGDVLLTTPLIRAIKKNKPESQIYFLTQKTSEDILKNNSYLSGIILMDKDTVKKLKEYKFDVVIDFMNCAISGYYTFKSGAKKRIAFYRPWGFWCYNIMPKYSAQGYTVNDRLSMLDLLDLKKDGINLDLNYNIKNEEKVFSFFKQNNISQKDLLISFDVTSKRDYKSWQSEKFAKLADMISEKLNAKVIFIYAPNEIDYVKNTMNLCKKQHILSFNTGLLDLTALIKNVKLHIGTSSAPGHIAVSQQTPTFIIYGKRTNPINWTPPGSDIHKYIQGDLDKLSVEEVFEKLKENYGIINNLLS